MEREFYYDIAIYEYEFMDIRRISHEKDQMNYIWWYIENRMKGVLSDTDLERYRIAWVTKSILFQKEVDRTSRIIRESICKHATRWEFISFNILRIYGTVPLESFIPQEYKDRIKVPMDSFNETMSILYGRLWRAEDTLYGHTSPDGVHIRSITFQVSEACNLKCSYCYQINKTSNRMDFNTAKIAIDTLLSKDEIPYVDKNTTHGFIWDFIGGEPFMECELITQICDYILQQMILNQHPYLLYSRFSASSNGTLHNTKPVQDIINNFGPYFSIGITVDGDKTLHDKCRVFADGSGSYDLAMSAVEDLRRRGNRLQSKVTISHDNLPYLYDAIIHMVHEGYIMIHANCVFEDVWDDEKDPLIYYEQLKKIAVYFLENDLYNKVFFVIFKEDGIGHMPEESNKNFCGGNGAMLAVNYAGNYYPCTRFMESSLGTEVEPYVIGNVNDGLMSNQEEIKKVNELKKITRRSQSTDECWECPVNSGCSHCTAYNYQVFGTPDKRATYICWMHKAEVLANVFYWSQVRIKYPIPGKEWELKLPKEDCLKIISMDEYRSLKMLENLQYMRGEKEHATV